MVKGPMGRSSSDSGHLIVKRMAGVELSAEDVAVPETPARTLRLALARSAQRALRLSLTVDTVADDTGPFDTIVPRFEEDLLHLGLMEGDDLAGYVVFDHSFRCALVEVQMMGRLSRAPDLERPVTSTDAALCGRIVSALFSDLCAPDRPGHFEPWVEGLEPGSKLKGPRAVTLALPDGNYRVLEFGVTLDAGDDEEARTGQLSLILPDRVTPPTDVKSYDDSRWSEAFSEVVRDAPVELLAVLHRTRKSLKDVSMFDVGGVIPLHGVTVDSLVIEASGREVVARGRLGQINGMRAVRVGDGTISQSMGAASLAAPTQAGGGALAMTPEMGSETEMPDMPGLADIDAPMGDGPVLDGLPDVEADAGLPDLPEMPPLGGEGDLQTLPDMEGADGLPDLPDLPDMGGGGGGGDDLPDLPDIGGDLPDLPDLPSLS